MLLSRNGINMRLCMRRVFAHLTSLQSAIGCTSRAMQVLFPFLLKSDQHCGALLTGRLSVQTERGVLDTRNGSVAGCLPRGLAPRSAGSAYPLLARFLWECLIS
jgi:hypothetical protein